MSETPTITISGTAYRVVTQHADTQTHRSFRVESEGQSYFLKVFRKEAEGAFDKQMAALASVKADAGLLLPIEIGEYNDERFVLRDWVEGETFDDYTRRFKFNPKHLDEALAVGEQFARAVASLHAEGIAHGRLKNENVYFDRDGDPVVTDPTGAGDPRDDVRQIGLLLCRLYTRKPTLVINSRTLMELSKAKVPMNLLKVLWQAIQDQPSQRFKDAGTLATALKEVPLKEHEKTVHVRALPDNVGPSDGLPAWLRNTAIFVVVIGLVAGGAWLLREYDSRPASTSSQPVATTAPAAGSATMDARLLRPRFTFETNLGKFEIEAYGDVSPIAVMNFAKHVEAGSFDGVAFDRVVPNFVIQAGQFTMTGDRKNSSLPPVRNEWLNGAEAVAGTVGMSRMRNDPDTITTAFFINLADNRRVFGTRNDGTGEVIFGKVSSGWDVVQSISQSKTVNKNGRAWPEPAIYITSAYLSQGFQAGQVLRGLEARQPPRKTLPSGVVIEDVVIGRGREFDPSRSVTIHYVGKFENGRTFDSSREREEPFTFPPNSYIQGLGEGLAGMRIGGRRIITIPPELGYGNTEIPGIPRNSTLIFDVHLIAQESNTNSPQSSARSPEGSTISTADAKDSIRIIYHRFDNAYDRPGLWVWNPDKQDSIEAREIFPSTTTSEGSIFEIPLTDLGIQGQTGERIGIIPRLRSDWDYKDGADRFWTPSLGNTVWLVQGENTIYTERPVLEPAVRRALLEDERTVRFITNRPLPDTLLNNTRSFSISTTSGRIEPVRVLPVRDGTEAVVSALATFPSSLYPLPPEATAGIQGMQPAPLRLGAVQKNPSVFSIDEPMGVTFTGTDAHFRVFSPNADRLDVEVFNNLSAASPSHTVSMMRGVNGVWEATLPRAQAEGNYYAYSVLLAGEVQPTRMVDPAAINFVGRQDRTRITEPRSTDPPGFRPILRPAFSGEMKDAVIYELHVQAFTAGGRTTHRQSGTFLGLAETGTAHSSERSVTTGMDHLKELGVTHVQLMPVSEFVPAPGSKDGYDWGYWPLAWMSPRGDFASTREGDARLREFKQMVQRLHAEGIGVIVDLPLAQLSVQSSIEAIAPGAYTFLDANGRPAMIGDQAYRIDSTAPAARALMLQTVRFWLEEMGVDGVRIEALGHIDKEAAEEILSAAKAINPAALVYGTPWGTGPSPHGQTTDKTALAGTGVGAYNDDFRNNIKGQPSGNSTGFVQSPSTLARRAEPLMAGSVGAFTTSSNDVLNLLTDHDGCTLWDKLVATTNLLEQERMKLHLLAQGILLVSQGGVLLNGGDELLWSRNGECWGWEAGLPVNTTPWANKARYRFATEYLAGLIALRRDHPVFRLGSAEEIRQRLRFLPAQQLPDPSCVAFTIDGNGLDDEAWSSVFIVINPTAEAHSLRLPDAQTWSTYVENGRTSTSPLSVATGRVQVSARTITLMARQSVP